MVVGFITTYALSATAKVVSWNPAHGRMYSKQQHVIKLASDLQQVCGFLRAIVDAKLE